MRIVTPTGHRGRSHQLFEVHTMRTFAPSTESVETPEYKKEKEKRIKLYKKLVQQQVPLGDDEN